MVLAAAPRMSAAEFQALFEAVSNWGRWGPADERGTLNYLSPQKTLAALQLPRSGETISLALPLAKEYAADTTYPVTHHMISLGDVDPTPQRWVMDWFGIAPHGYIHSHLDALCHCALGDRLYNGHPLSSATTLGARQLDITAAAQGIVTRGVLLDIPRLHGLEWLEPMTPILEEDLQGAERSQGVRVGEGDVLLVRTGRHRRRAARGPWNPETEGAPGLHASSGRWLFGRHLAALGGDLSSDVLPSGVEGVPEPMHTLALVAMGMHLLDNLWLEDLAQACARLGRWEFLLLVAPLRLPGGSGSPCSPIAVL